MSRFITTAVMAAVLVISVHPVSAQDEAVDFTARGGVKDLIGRVGALEARPDADTLGGLSCFNGEIAKYNGTDWVCAADEDTDTLGGLNCTTDQIAKFNGTAWVCATADNGGIFVRMSAEEEVTIAQNGPLQLIAQCETTSNGQRIVVFVTSTEDGWFLGGQGDVGIAPLSAGQLIEYGRAEGDITKWNWINVHQRPAISPSGHYLWYNLALGVNILGADCLATGPVFAVTEP